MAGRALASQLIRSSRVCLRSACHLQKPLQASAWNQFSRSPSCVIQTASIQTTSLRFNENIINIQDPDDFKTRVLESDKPVIVDFHASWCGPCKMLGPRLEAMSAVGEGSVILAKVDIDELQDVAIEFGVEAVPTVYAMKGGKVQDKFVGVKDDDGLQAFADKLLVK